MKIRLYKSSIVYFLLVFVSLLPAMTFLPSPLRSLSALGVCCIFLMGKKTYLLFPVFIFYYSYFDNIFGLSVFRWFTFLFFLDIFLHDMKKLRKIPFTIYCVLLIYLTYSVAVVAPHELKLAAFVLWDIYVACLLVLKLRENMDALKQFCYFYVFIALVSFVVGYLLGTDNLLHVNTLLGGTVVRVSRYCGTFEDPNYMGFFYTIAVFSIVSLKLYTKKLRVLIIALLYAMVLFTLSITALIGNVLLWTLFLIVDRKINIKTVAAALVLITAALQTYHWALTQPPDNPVTQLSLRVEDKLDAFFSGDVDDFTTGRTSIAEQHMEFFKDQTIVGKLIGMNAVNTRFVQLDGYQARPAHNEYVDMLLNVGILGSMALLAYILHRILRLMVLYRETKQAGYLCLLMYKLIWCYYVATLTVFLDYRFFIFYLI